MPQAQQTSTDTQGGSDKKKWRSSLWFWLVLYGFLVLIGLSIGSCYFKNGADRAKFWVEGLLSAGVLSAVIVQVIINTNQWRVMERQFVHSERAYVGIHSIKQRPSPHSDSTEVRIENTGRLPADSVDVKIAMILLLPENIAKKHAGVLPPESAGSWWMPYHGTRLFRGSLHYQILIDLADWFRPVALMEVFAGNARLIAQVSIGYKDGLGNSERSDYAFRLEAQGHEWMAWPVWKNEELESRVAEEKSRYHPK